MLGSLEPQGQLDTPRFVAVSDNKGSRTGPSCLQSGKKTSLKALLGEAAVYKDL